MHEQNFIANARTALKIALENIPNYQDGYFIIPKFCCDVILQPFIDLKIKYKFYEISNKTFKINRNNLNKLTKKYNVKGMVLINYFGYNFLDNEIIKFLKKKKIILIEDNVHGANFFKKKKFINKLNTVKIFSERKLFNSINSGGSIISNFISNKNIQNSIRYLNNSSYFKYFVFFIIKKIFNFKTLKLELTKRINLNDPRATKEIGRKYHKIFYLDYRYIKKQNLYKLKNTRIQNWYKIKNICKRNNFQPYFKNFPSSNSYPWVFPIRAKSQLNRNKIINFFLKNKYIAFTWPVLPDEILSKDKKTKTLWKNLVCVSLD